MSLGVKHKGVPALTEGQMCKGKKTVCVLLGNLTAGLGVALCAAAGIGLDPVSALYDGAHRILSLEMGTASFVVNILILLICTLLNRKYLKWGTFLSMISFAVSLNVFARLLAPLHLQTYSLPSFGVFFAGMLLAGGGFATVVFQKLGPNCADILLEVLKDRAGIPMRYGKITVDICCTVLGFLLGGAVGMGTILCVLSMGYIYDQAYRAWQHLCIWKEVEG